MRRDLSSNFRIGLLSRRFGNDIGMICFRIEFLWFPCLTIDETRRSKNPLSLCRISLFLTLYICATTISYKLINLRLVNSYIYLFFSFFISVHRNCSLIGLRFDSRSEVDLIIYQRRWKKGDFQHFVHWRRVS